MEQVIVKKKSGQKFRLFQYNKISGITSADQTCSLAGEDVVNMSLVSAEPLQFDLGDIIDVFGRIYTLNTLPNVKKINDRRFEYDIQFEGAQYELIKVQYLDIDESGFSTGTTFSLMGNMETFATLIIANLQRLYGATKWQLGEVPAGTEFQNVDFQNETCLQVLQKICDLYDQNFDIERLPGDDYRLNIRLPTTVLDDVFIYGRGRGLYGLERMKANDKNIVTRLFAYGAAKNLPLDYRGGSTRLKMPLQDIFSEAQPYIEDQQAIDAYGIIEGSMLYEDIFPNRTGTVTGINAGNVLQFYDTAMNFDLFEIVNGSSTYLISGTPAKVVFKTGNLAGYEFSLNSSGGYIHSERKFTLLPYTDDNGQVFPDANELAFQIQVGDQYTLVDIALPQSYITAAETLLEQTAGQYLFDNSKPRVLYGLTIDANYIRHRAPSPSVIINYFTVGFYVKVKDTDLRIDGSAQIQSFKRNILKHYEYDLTLGDEEVNSQRRIYRINRKKQLQAAINRSSLFSASYIAQITNIASTVIAETPSGSGIFTIGW